MPSGRVPTPSGMRVVGPGETSGSSRRKRTPPEPLRELSPEAADLWDRVVATLTRVNVVKELDAAALTVMCELWADYVRAVAIVREQGMTVELGNGRQLAHPMIGVARSAARELKGYFAMFGLTPSSETALGVSFDSGTAPRNPFA